jgi:hypothetical protein
MLCPYCGAPARWVENKEVYGKNYGKSFMMWLCKPCDARVGCHQNTKNPLGTLANKELRTIRMKAHAAFDPLWKTGRMKRWEAYKWLAEKMGVKEIHIGESDEETCLKIISLIHKNL